jgi:DeoR family transcriptional regulator, aga operon transcriptional repressor
LPEAKAIGKTSKVRTDSSTSVLAKAADSIDVIPAEVRQKLMLQHVEQRGFVRVRDLSEHFGVSTVTVRADLASLEHQGLAHRVRGGAVSQQRGGVERSFEEVATEATAEKATIAKAAAALVRTGDSILIDVGTTAAAFSRALVERADLTDLTVFTNGLKIALELERAHPRFSVVVIGGTLRPKQHSLVNPLAAQMLDGLRVRTAFIGCNGVDVDSGVTNVNLPEAEVKRAMIAAADRCVVIADASKLGQRTLVQVCPIDRVDLLVTNATAEPNLVATMRDNQVEVVLA